MLYDILGTLNAASNRMSPNRWSHRKALASHAASNKPICCVGETLPSACRGLTEKGVAGIGAASQVDQRRRRKKRSLRMSLLWAIATASTQLRSRAQDSILLSAKTQASHIDETVAKHERIQYGGSDKSSNRPRNR